MPDENPDCMFSQRLVQLAGLETEGIQLLMWHLGSQNGRLGRGRVAGGCCCEAVLTSQPFSAHLPPAPVHPQRMRGQHQLGEARGGGRPQSGMRRTHMSFGLCPKGERTLISRETMMHTSPLHPAGVPSARLEHGRRHEC